ncbi:unnamed protein product [Pocillopora meandrina]|uniref:Uncharacterized protein n=1 Tax=Pocillopora meandrina TaxID=46732 RepID=A0AAU9XXJ0_9CNID|nr:unnamed protein product [Pocillopora meandrina]
MADQVDIHVTYKDSKHIISCPKGEVVEDFTIRFLEAFADMLPREVEPSDVKFQLHVEKFDDYVDLQSNELLKDGSKLRVRIPERGQSPIKPHPIQPNTIYRLWSPVSRKNEGVVMRNSSTNIVTCSGTFSPCGDTLMETIDKTNGQTASFALQFKDGANKALTLTGDGKGKPVEAKVIEGAEESIFEPEYFWSYTMFKQRGSGYYLGCDDSGTLTLVENWNLEYPNPQALFIVNKPNKST